MAWFQAAVFLSAFLLFQVQPMLSKALLPGFGGSYLVWGAAMVFFQGMLLAGYAFSHAMQHRLGVRRYALLHLVLLLLPLVFFPFDFDRLATAGGAGAPAPRVLLILLLTAGAPFFMLSTVSLVLQRWLAASTLPARHNPYVLYAVSNAGSVLALLTYPVLVEPLVDLPRQGMVWWIGYAMLWLLHAGALAVAHRRSAGPTDDASECGVATGAGMATVVVTPGEAAAASEAATGGVARWMLLSAAGCATLLAVTNVLTFDVAAVPFLWVLPLALYLTAFIVTFKARMWFPRAASAAFYWVVPCGVLLHLTGLLRMTLSPAVMLSAHLCILFVVCWNCAAGLVASRPAEEARLTAFYLALAAGGLAGSLVVSWVVPLLSSTLVEYPLALALACGAVGLVGGLPARPPRRAVIAGVAATAGVALVLLVLPRLVAAIVRVETLLPTALTVALGLPLVLLLRSARARPLRLALLTTVFCVAGIWSDQPGVRVHTVLRLRNYYGIYRVYDRDGIRHLQHGTTQHGRQHLDPERAGVPLGYYHPSTPIAEALAHPPLAKQRIAMVGLGAGALAAYLGEGQHMTIYEIDPDNRAIAEAYFDYLAQGRRQGAAIDFVTGDGRVRLREQPAESYDLLILDAFSSGSIPVHLLTVEAFAEYLRVLRPGGAVLLHVSNQVLDLLPVVYSNAAALDVRVCEISNAVRPHPEAERTDWAALTHSEATYKVLRQELGWWRRRPPSAGWPRPWTDRYSNLFGAMLW